MAPPKGAQYDLFLKERMATYSEHGEKYFRQSSSSFNFKEDCKKEWNENPGFTHLRDFMRTEEAKMRKLKEAEDKRKQDELNPAARPAKYKAKQSTSSSQLGHPPDYSAPAAADAQVSYASHCLPASQVIPQVSIAPYESPYGSKYLSVNQKGPETSPYSYGTQPPPASQRGQEPLAPAPQHQKHLTKQREEKDSDPDAHLFDPFKPEPYLQRLADRAGEVVPEDYGDMAAPHESLWTLMTSAEPITSQTSTSLPPEGPDQPSAKPGKRRQKDVAPHHAGSSRKKRTRH